jgi:hypothetical protein
MMDMVVIWDGDVKQPRSSTRPATASQPSNGDCDGVSVMAAWRRMGPVGTNTSIGAIGGYGMSRNRTRR